ncbi:MAG: alpha/beta hydrolase, partial [Bacteroidota bacterium]
HQMRKPIYLFLFGILFLHFQGLAQELDTLINVGSHSLHVNVLPGEGTPILFEAGNGDDGSVWEPLLKEIYEATGATLIRYDRAGLGKSGIDSTKISFKREVKHLEKVLKKVGYKADYFLVAHSFGSFYASEFAQRNKGKITGAVFIDVATPCGINPKYAEKVRSSISKENWKLIKEYKAGLYYVLQHFPEITDYMSDRFITSAVPVTVIAAEIREPTKEIGDTEEDMIRMANCLRDYGNLPNHTYVLANGTEHKVWKKDPQLVIKEIVKLYSGSALKE